MRKTSFQGIAVLLGFFLLGAGFGAGVMTMVVRSNPSIALRPGGPGPGPPSQRKIAHMVEDELTAGLDLNASQKESIRKEFEVLHEDFEAVQDEYRPRLEGIMEELRQRVLSHLEDDQQEAFNESFDRWLERRPRGPMPPPGPHSMKGPPPKKGPGGPGGPPPPGFHPKDKDKEPIPRGEESDS